MGSPCPQGERETPVLRHMVIPLPMEGGGLHCFTLPLHGGGSEWGWSADRQPLAYAP
jgi:hypothetical protein